MWNKKKKERSVTDLIKEYIFFTSQWMELILSLTPSVADNLAKLSVMNVSRVKKIYAAGSLNFLVGCNSQKTSCLRDTALLLFTAPSTLHMHVGLLHIVSWVTSINSIKIKCHLVSLSYFKLCDFLSE